MKPLSPQKLAMVRNLVARERRRGVNVDFEDGVFTVTDPTGVIHTADMRSRLNDAATWFFSDAMRLAFQSYILNQIAPPNFDHPGDCYFTWREGAYRLIVFITRYTNFTDGDYHLILHAVDDEQHTVATADELRKIHDGCCRKISFRDWPKPDELRQLPVEAIEEFKRYKLFQHFMSSSNVYHHIVPYRVEIPPLSVAFQNGKPSVSFIERFTNQTEETAKALHLVQEFMALDLKPRISDDTTTTGPAEVTVDLV